MLLVWQSSKNRRSYDAPRLTIFREQEILRCSSSSSLQRTGDRTMLLVKQACEAGDPTMLQRLELKNHINYIKMRCRNSKANRNLYIFSFCLGFHCFVCFVHNKQQLAIATSRMFCIECKCDKMEHWQRKDACTSMKLLPRGQWQGHVVKTMLRRKYTSNI